MVLSKPPRKESTDGERVHRLPRRGRDAENLKLDRAVAAHKARTDGIDPLGVAFERGAHDRRGAVPDRKSVV
jgi:hypothetical protein